MAIHVVIKSLSGGSCHFCQTKSDDHEKNPEKGLAIWGLLLNNVAYLRLEFLTKLSNGL
jgi:hypothetical protein